MQHYVCVVGFETEKIDKQTGEPKVKKYKFLVDGVTLYDALMTMTDYLKDDTRGYDIKSIAEAKFEEILKSKDSVKSSVTPM